MIWCHEQDSIWFTKTTMKIAFQIYQSQWSHGLSVFEFTTGKQWVLISKHELWITKPIISIEFHLCYTTSAQFQDAESSHLFWSFGDGINKDFWFKVPSDKINMITDFNYNDLIQKI